MKCSELELDPANVRLHDARNLEAIKQSLEKFGQQKPIVVDGDGIVRAGNGTLMAARELGWKTISAVRTELTGDEAIAYAVADNRTAELAEWDRAELAALLDRLDAESDGEWSGLMGFTEDDRRNLLADLDGLGGLAQPEGTKKKGSGPTGDAPDGNWFYVEYYGKDELFEELKALLEGKLKTVHEIEPDAFEALVRNAHKS